MDWQIGCSGFSQLDISFINVTEFRHESWWDQNIFDRLGEKNITFCGISYPSLPATAIVNTSFAYYRFHGVPDLYRSSYSEDELNKTYEELIVSNELTNAYVFFNNTEGVAAIDNAAYLKTLIDLP